MAEIPLSKTAKFIVDNRGRTAPTANSGIPLIATNCINNKNLYPVYENIRYVSKETYETWFRSHPQPNDIIITLKGSQNGAVCLAPDPVDFVIAQDMVALRADESVIDPLYLFAALRSEDVQHQIKNLDVSGVIPHFKKGDFDKLLIPYPDKDLQKTIGDTYFNLSKKIDLLQCQNKTLEAIAETLFRQWFIEEAGEGWESVRLGDCIQFLKGKKPNQALEKFSEGLVPQILIETFDTGHTLFSEPTNMVVAKEKDILMVMDGASSGRVEIGFNGIVGSTIGLFRPLPDFNFPLFLYHFIESNEGHIQENTTGSAIPHADKALIQNLDLTYPNVEKIKGFENLAQSWFEKTQSNKNQIRSLSKLRDTLLPKLMSGEVRMKK